MKIKTETIHRVNYGDLEEAIAEAFNIGYELVSDVECGNDTALEINGITKQNACWELEGDDGMAPFNRENLAKWIATVGGKQLWGPRLLMLDMVRRGLIPEGNYVISVSW